MATTIEQNQMGIDEVFTGWSPISFTDGLRKIAGAALVGTAMAVIGGMLTILGLTGVTVLTAWLLG